MTPLTKEEFASVIAEMLEYENRQRLTDFVEEVIQGSKGSTSVDDSLEAIASDIRTRNKEREIAESNPYDPNKAALRRMASGEGWVCHPGCDMTFGDHNHHR